MKTLKGTQKSEFLFENREGYIYKSVTAYDSKYDIIQYVVDTPNNDFGDRFDNLEDALKFMMENVG